MSVSCLCIYVCVWRITSRWCLITWCLMPVLQVIFPTTLSAYTIASFLALLGATLYCREVCLAAAVFVFIWAWVGLSVCLSASLTVRKLLKKYGRIFIEKRSGCGPQFAKSRENLTDNDVSKRMSVTGAHRSICNNSIYLLTYLLTITDYVASRLHHYVMLRQCHCQ